MFRAIIRNASITKNLGYDLLKFCPCATAIPQANEDKGLFHFDSFNFFWLFIRISFEFSEYNYVKLLGTIVSTVRALPNGTKSLIVRTTDGSDK